MKLLQLGLWFLNHPTQKFLNSTTCRQLYWTNLYNMQYEILYFKFAIHPLHCYSKNALIADEMTGVTQHSCLTWWFWQWNLLDPEWSSSVINSIGGHYRWNDICWHWRWSWSWLLWSRLATWVSRVNTDQWRPCSSPCRWSGKSTNTAM
jgi:hypothetical protein